VSLGTDSEGVLEAPVVEMEEGLFDITPIGVNSSTTSRSSLTVELLAATHKDFVAYAERLAGELGQDIELVTLIAPMLACFTVTYLGFAKARRKRQASSALR
jgi:hypothetical protein